MNNNILPSVGLSLAIGFAIGWAVKPSEPATSSRSPIQHPQTMAASAASPDRGKTDYSLQMDFANTAISSFVKRGTIPGQDMQQVMDRITATSDPIERAAMFSVVLANLSPDNAEAAFEALRTSRDGFGRVTGPNMRLLLNAWGRLDGESAVRRLTAIAEADRNANGGRGRDNHGNGNDQDRDAVSNISNVLTGLATADAEAAASYLASIDDEKNRSKYSRAIVSGLLVNGVADAVAYISELPAEGAGRDRLMVDVANAMLDTGLANATSWLERLSDDLKPGAINQISDRYAREDLASAVSWIAQFAGENYATDALNDVAESWAESDPAAVVDWALDLPASAQPGVFKEAMDEWAESDPTAASQHLTAMQDSPAKDLAVEGFAKELVKTDPHPAAVWAATITNDEVRLETLKEVTSQWSKSDPDAAEAWLQSN
ncbi:MAG: hypothetical protein ACI9R3_003940 [Verrucomicrobiales bacterium]|jgi:hypothetical protein